MSLSVADKPSTIESFLRQLNSAFTPLEADIAVARQQKAASEGYNIHSGMWGGGDPDSDGDPGDNADSASVNSFVQSTIRNSQPLNDLYQGRLMGSSNWIDPSQDARLSHYMGTPATQGNIADAQNQVTSLSVRADALAQQPQTVANVIALQDARMSQKAAAAGVVTTSAAQQSRGGDVATGVLTNVRTVAQRDELRAFVGQKLGMTPEQQAALKNMSTEDFSAAVNKALANKTPEEQKAILKAYNEKSEELQKNAPPEKPATDESPVDPIEIESPQLSVTVTPDTPAASHTSAASALHDGGDIKTSASPTSAFKLAALPTLPDPTPAPAAAPSPAPAQAPAPQQQFALPAPTPPR